MSTKTAKTPARVLMIVPTLGKRIDLLEQTLESFEDQGSFKPDVILVCPAKSSEARDLARKFGASVADDPGTLSGAINVGVSMAKPHHEYITWLGDDDLLRPYSLAVSVPTLDKNPSAVLAYGYCDYIEDDGKLILTSRAGKLAPWIMTWGPNLVPLPGMVYRLSALKKAGEFNTSLKYAMDLDMLLRLRKFGSFINTKKTLAAFRWHSSSTTVANRIASLNEAEMIKRQYLSRYARPFVFLWEKPVRLATLLASRRVSALARRRAALSS